MNAGIGSDADAGTAAFLWARARPPVAAFRKRQLP